MEAEARGAMAALREFSTSCCGGGGSVGGGSAGVHGRTPALELAVAPPPLEEEFAHEDALDFAFADELKVARQLCEQAGAGRALIAELYCSRSCSRAILAASPDADDAPLMKEYYRTVYEILYPQIVKIKGLSDYCSKTILLLSDSIQRLTVNENAARTIPDVLMDALLELTDVVFQLSNLHNVKSSLRNDFTVFKRIYLNVKERNEEAERIERDMARLQEFMANSNVPNGAIWAALLHNLANIKRFDQIIFLLLKRCVISLESNPTELPSIRFMRIRLIAQLKYILEEFERSNKGKSAPGVDRKLIETASKVCMRYPVVPIVGELSSKPSSSNPTNKSIKGSDIPVGSLDLIAVANNSNTACKVYLSRLLPHTNLTTHQKSSDAKVAVYTRLVEGIALASEWNSSVKMFIAMKQQTVESSSGIEPTNHEDGDSLLEGYTRSLKKAYSDEECVALISLIHNTKRIVLAIRESFYLLVDYARRHVYTRVQTFVQCDILPLLHRSDKRNLVCTKALHDARLCSGDWENIALLANDFKKKRKERQLPHVPDKCAAISLSQLQMIRTQVDSIYSKRSMAELNSKQGTASSIFSFKRDLDSADIERLRLFYIESADFHKILALESTVAELDDFSTLWFRELQLESSQAIQFPTSASLPWMLIEVALQYVDEIGIDPVLSILDIYNNAAYCSLHQFKKQFLFDEAISEGNLCYDFLTRCVAECLHVHNKCFAASSVDMLFRSTQKNAFLEVQQSKLNAHSLALRKINIFGADHQFSSHLAHHIRTRTRKDLDAWVKKLSQSGIANVVDILRILMTYQAVHRQLSYLVLSPFEEVLEELTNVSITVDSSTSDVHSHVQQFIVTALLTDLFQQYSVVFENDKLVKSPPHPALAAAIDNDDSAQYYQARYDACQLEQLISTPEVKAILHLLRPRQVIEVTERCISFIIAKVEDVLSLCLPALGSTIPPYRLPRFMYRTEGCFGFFEGKFKHLFDSDELEAQVFHCFREIGNALMFLFMLDTEWASLNAGRSDIEVTKIFVSALHQITAALHQTGLAEEWCAPLNSQPDALENSAAFYHVWIAIEFISCCRPRGSNDPDLHPNRAFFGDGLQFAGCTLIHILGQRSLYELWNASQHVVNARDWDLARVVPGGEDVMRDASDAISSHSVTTHKRWKKSPAGAKSTSGSSTYATVGSLDHEMKSKARSFLQAAQKMRNTSVRIFHVLERYWPLLGSAASGSFDPPAFVPPVHSRSKDDNRNTL